MEQELLKNNFERHGFKTSFFDTKEAALDYLEWQAEMLFMLRLAVWFWLWQKLEMKG